LNLPNKLSLSRIFLVLPVIFLLNYSNLKWFTVCLYILICFTDWLDGWLARKYNDITVLGQFLDPLADKVIILLPIIFFVAKGTVDPWTAMIVVGREIFVTGLRLLAVNCQIVIAAGIWGKVKTVLQMLSVILLILESPWAQYFYYVSVLVSVWSGFMIWEQGKTIFKQY